MDTITIKGVSKCFKGVELFDNVNAEFQSGLIYGIVGPNGTGKSVLLKLICGLLAVDHGEIFFNNKLLHTDIDVLPSCGIVINKPAFFDDMSGYENLKLLAQLSGNFVDEEIHNVLKKVGLKDDNKKVGKYSLGMQQRLGIAQAIMEKPDILILDEFTNALDEDGIEMVHKIVKEERDKNVLVIITSHNRTEINELCDIVYKISKGTLVHEK